MKHKWSKILFWLFTLLPFLVSALCYSRLPARVATHFNASGAPNGYSSREMAAFGLPAFYFAITLFVFVMLKIDPKSDNINRSPKVKAAVLWGVVILFNLVHTAMLLNDVGFKLSIGVITGVSVGLLFAVIGNYLPKCKPNYTMGIRLPWTLASEENWRRTHRFAGPLWTAGGIVIALSGLLGWAWTVLPVAAVLCVVPGVYSYLLFRKEKSAKP